IDLGQEFAVYVDFAHSASSLASVLAALRPTTAGRLLAVFGATGRGDHDRPGMGRSAAQGADWFVITTDDPVKEDPAEIARQVEAGASGRVRGRDYEVEPDRRRAIRRALGVAEVYELLVRRHPALEPDRALVRPTRNQEFVGWEDPVGDGDEVAFIPPVSGGTEAAHLIRLTAEPLDVHLTEVAVAHAGAGAICSFTGVVRDNNRGEPVTHLEYEAYGGMAERQMRRIADEIAE